MPKKQFQTESKQLLNLMIHSIYTNREIFLRELISNASDACDKLYFKSLTDHTLGVTKEDLKISLIVDKEKRTLTITDTGIGMTPEELEENLGIIANSGSQTFKQQHDDNEDVDIIGQFGVGFYAAFMVSDHLTVVTRAAGSEEAYRWESEGADGYIIEPYEGEMPVGTQITLALKPNEPDINYNEFLDSYRLKSLVKKYSDYIRYPIIMDVEQPEKKQGVNINMDEDSSTKEVVVTTEILNSMIPLWRKSKAELTTEDYNTFYREKFMDFADPLRVIHTKTEGAVTYNALLYLPEQIPHDYYTKGFEKGLQLYSSGVLIMEKCADLLPDHFSFVKGLVDSEDLSLNISRELLQQDGNLKVIAKSLEKKIKNELSKMLKDDRELYEKFFATFGIQLKFGIYHSYGMNKRLLEDLILFRSSAGTGASKHPEEAGYTTLAEYVSRMKEGQTQIYYATGASVARIQSLPQTERVLDKGFEILFCTDGVDEFTIQMMIDYQEHLFQSISAGDFELDANTDEETELFKQQVKESKALCKAMKKSLGGNVKEVQLSQRLKSHPVCLANHGKISLEMEKALGSMPGGDQSVKADQILELNPQHPVFSVLQQLLKEDTKKLARYTEILYAQALLIEGMPLPDPVAYATSVYDLMVDPTAGV